MIQIETLKKLLPARAFCKLSKERNFGDLNAKAIVGQVLFWLLLTHPDEMVEKNIKRNHVAKYVSSL